MTTLMLRKRYLAAAAICAACWTATPAMGQPPPSLHSPLFYPDVEETLATGITAMAGAALELLPPAE